MNAAWIVLALAAGVALALIVWKVAKARRPAPQNPPPRYVCDQCNDSDCVCSRQDTPAGRSDG